jgi:putative endonuclease
MPWQYDFWIYIITNRNHSVLYIGLTNSLSRRAWEHRQGTGANFPAAYRCNKLIYHEYYENVPRSDRARIAVKEMVTSKES